MTLGAIVLLAILIAFFKGVNRKIGFWWSLYFSVFLGSIIGYIITNNSSKNTENILATRIGENAKYLSFGYLCAAGLSFYSVYKHGHEYPIFYYLLFGFIGASIYVITKRNKTSDAIMVLSLSLGIFITYSYNQKLPITPTIVLSSNEKMERDMKLEGFGIMPSFNLGMYDLDSLSKSLKEDTAFRIVRTFYIDTSNMYLIYVDPLFNYNDSSITRTLYNDFYNFHKLGVAKNIETVLIYKNFLSDSAKSTTFEPKMLWMALRPRTKYYNTLMKNAYGDTTY